MQRSINLYECFTFEIVKKLPTLTPIATEYINEKVNTCKAFIRYNDDGGTNIQMIMHLYARDMTLRT